ncbi:membrane protein, partial [Rhodomicrobium udaipurense JA643]
GLLLYALGRYTGVFTLLYYYLPGVDMFRRPADATYALCAMTAILGGYMLHRVLTGADEFTREQTKWLAFGIGGLCVTGLGVAAFHEHFRDALEPVAMALAVFAVGWGTLVFARRHAAGQGALAVLALAGFMTADLVINNGPNRSTALPPSTYDELLVNSKNETLALLKERLSQPPGSARRDRVELVGLGFEWPNTSLVHGFDHSLGYNPLRIAEFVEAMGDVETTAETYQRDFTPLFPSYRSTLADMMGIRYIAVDEPVEHLDKQLKPGDLKFVTHTNDAYVYENPRALPRVLFAFDWQPANFTQLKKDGRWPVFDPRRTVLFHAERPQMVILPPKPVSMPEARAALRTYQNTVVEVEVETPAPGFVVLNDNWHPWWFGTVDGKPADIYRANVLFRAIQVPAGKHLVRFEFKPVEGAIREVRARLEGKSLEPGLPQRTPRIRPEASLPVAPRPAG